MDAAAYTTPYIRWEEPVPLTARPVARVRGPAASNDLTNSYDLVDYDQDFAIHFGKLRAIERDQSLWPEDAEAPNPNALYWAKMVLRRLADDMFLPTRVVASAEGGVAICFVKGDKYADVECLNAGMILGVLSNRRDRPAVWEVEPSPSGIARASSRIRLFLNSQAPGANVPGESGNR